MNSRTTALAISASMLLVLLSAPLTVADTASGEAGVGNALPQVVSSSVENNAADNSVDPESYFWIKVKIRDNNKLSDIDNVIVKCYDNSLIESNSDSKTNHYTFWFDPTDNSWHTTFSSNTLGDAFIDTANSTYPSDLTVSEDNYNFKILLNGTATSANDWDIYVKAVDGGGSDDSETANAFSVNTYISYSLGVSSIEWSNLSVPSTDNPSDNNPVKVENIETNVTFDVQNKLSADWTSGANTIGADNTSFENDDPNGSSGNLSTGYSDVYTGHSSGENLSRGINYYLDVPDGTIEGTYTTTFYIETVQN